MAIGLLGRKVGVTQIFEQEGERAGQVIPVTVIQAGPCHVLQLRTMEKDGYIADSRKTYMVGDVAPLASRLVRVTYEALWKGIAAVRPGATLGDIGHAIERHAKRHDYSIVREYCGHGIGREMHEEPQVLHFGKPGTGVRLREGMVFTIEPMLNQGTAKVKTEEDGWTVVTRDGKLSAQFEHTVAVTANGVRVLTLRPGEEKMLAGIKHAA